MEKSLIVFLPGILGTELLDSNRDLSREVVWGGSLATILNTLSNPRILTRPSLRPGNVIREITSIGDLRGKKVYEKILDFLTANFGYQFVPFPYDWRQSISTSATQLGQFLQERIAAGVEQISLVAHSMGGLVVRALLADPNFAGVSKCVRQFIQIGTPVLGSCKAFIALRQSPDFGAIVEFALRQAQGLKPIILHDLLDSLSTFDSLFQLLPPETERSVLLKVGSESAPLLQRGEYFAAVDENVWLPHYHPQLAKARGVHTRIQRQPEVPHRVIYSDGIKTLISCRVDSDINVVGDGDYAPGDRTVAAKSASWGGGFLEPIRKGIQHDDLPNHRDVLALLNTYLRPVT